MNVRFAICCSRRALAIGSYLSLFLLAVCLNRCLLAALCFFSGFSPQSIQGEGSFAHSQTLLNLPNGQTVHILNSSWKCSIFCYRPAVRTVLGMHACWLLRTNSCCCYCCEYLFTQRCEQSAGVSAYVHQQVSVRIFLEFFFSVFFIMLNGHSLCIEPKSAAAETASPSLTMASCKNERYSKNERANKQKKISDSDLDMDYFRQPPRELDIHTNIHIAVLCMPHNNTVLY